MQKLGLQGSEIAAIPRWGDRPFWWKARGDKYTISEKAVNEDSQKKPAEAGSFISRVSEAFIKKTEKNIK